MCVWCCLLVNGLGVRRFCSSVVCIMLSTSEWLVCKVVLAEYASFFLSACFFLEIRRGFWNMFSLSSCIQLIKFYILITSIRRYY